LSLLMLRRGTRAIWAARAASAGCRTDTASENMMKTYPQCDLEKNMNAFCRSASENMLKTYYGYEVATKTEDGA